MKEKKRNILWKFLEVRRDQQNQDVHGYAEEVKYFEL